MAIEVGVNSYVTEAELIQYAADRDTIFSGNPSGLLLQAMDYLESLSYIGRKTNRYQPLQWPRSYVLYEGYVLDNMEVPQQIKNAQMSLAIAIDKGYNPLAVTDNQNVISESVGPLSVTYSSSSSSTVILRSVNAFLAPFLIGGGSLNQIRVSKA